MSKKNESIPLPEERVEQMRKIAQQNFSRWNEILMTGNAQEVAALYEKDATFLPTVSGEFKRGPVGAEEYFEHFIEKNPIGRIIKDEVQIISPVSYLHSGMYDFEVGLTIKEKWLMLDSVCFGNKTRMENGK
ncbi:hypothetical protein MYX07_01190 [Patescibacteria group bacterium AH-259-L07]|nr:hypothetical protein [Patescibacteria group bacterium AH-259-L07]